jgi:MFS family permease
VPEEPIDPEPVPAGDRAGRLGMFSRLAVDTRPLRHRDFRNLWIGQAISTIGGMIGTVAVPFQMYDLTHSTLMVGLLGLAALVPLLVVPLWGGAVADAGDRRSVLLRTEVGMVVVTGLFLTNALLPHPQAWALFVLEAAAVTVFSLGRPAMSSLTPRLVPDDEVAAAIALQSVYWSLAAVAGPALGGILIAGVGVPATYGIDLATYAASLVALYLLPRIPPTGEADRPSLRAIADGFRFLKGRQALIGIFVVDTNAMIFGMPSALFPALAQHEFGGGARTVGYLFAAPYGGALVGSLLSGWTSRTRRQGLAVTVWASVWGAAIVGFGLAPSLPLALLFLGIAGGADFFSAVLRTAILMRAAPDHMRGRLSGIEYAQVAGAPNLGNLEAGVVASLFGLRASVVSGGVLCVVGCAATALALPRFLRYDARRPEETA